MWTPCLWTWVDSVKNLSVDDTVQLPLADALLPYAASMWIYVLYVMYGAAPRTATPSGYALALSSTCTVMSLSVELR